MKALQKGFNVVTLKTTHANGRVIKVSKNLLVLCGCEYGNTKIAPKTEKNLDDGTIAFVYEAKRKPSYTYVNKIIARYNKSGEFCIPMLLVSNPKWKLHSVEYFNENGDPITLEEAESLGYKPNNSKWIVPKCTSIIAVGKID